MGVQRRMEISGSIVCNGGLAESHPQGAQADSARDRPEMSRTGDVFR